MSNVQPAAGRAVDTTSLALGRGLLICRRLRLLLLLHDGRRTIRGTRCKTVWARRVLSIQPRNGGFCQMDGIYSFGGRMLAEAGSGDGSSAGDEKGGGAIGGIGFRTSKL